MKLLVVVFLFALGTALAQEVVIDAQPFLKFQNPPFILDGIMTGPLRETVQALGWSVGLNGKTITIAKKDYFELDFSNMPNYAPKTKEEKRLIRCFFQLDDKVRGGKVTFVPLRLLSQIMNESIEINGNLLTIGDKTWQVNEKLIVIDRGYQKVYAYEGLKQVYQCRTCTGRPGYTTPTGIFRVYKKIRGQHKVVGKPWGGIMYNSLYYDGCAALHGSTEMRRRPSSHGCCRLFYRDANWLYPWTPIGTPVYVIP